MKMKPENREKTTKRHKKTYYRVRVTRKPPAHKNWRKIKKQTTKGLCHKKTYNRKPTIEWGQQKTTRHQKKMKMKPGNREQTEKAETVLAGTPENHLHIKTEIRKVGQNHFLGLRTKHQWCWCWCLCWPWYWWNHVSVSITGFPHYFVAGLPPSMHHRRT